MLTFVLENHRIRNKYAQKILYTFSINKIIFTNGEREKERPNFYEVFSQNLPISLAFIVILKMELPQCNAIGVRTPPVSDPSSTLRVETTPYDREEPLPFSKLSLEG